MMRTTGGQASRRLAHDSSTVSAHVQLSGSRSRKGPSMRVLAAIGILAILAVIVTAVFLFGGFYSVAANEPDLVAVSWAMEKIRDASIGHNAHFAVAANLDDAGTVQAGARAFSQRGCATCHGAPGVESQKFSEGMNPDPPDLKDVAGDTEPAELFWVIKNGIKMTGMPSFGKIGMDNKEIWSVVTFIRKLPMVSEADFKTWTAGP
jgi:mono/diheme cytochrome c family protein